MYALWIFSPLSFATVFNQQAEKILITKTTSAKFSQRLACVIKYSIIRLIRIKFQGMIPLWRWFKFDFLPFYGLSSPIFPSLSWVKAASLALFQIRNKKANSFAYLFKQNGATYLGIFPIYFAIFYPAINISCIPRLFSLQVYNPSSGILATLPEILFFGQSALFFYPPRPANKQRDGNDQNYYSYDLSLM